MNPLIVRQASGADHEAVWQLIEPVLRAGETYSLPRDWDRRQGLAYWFGPPHDVWVAELGGRIVGSYYLQPNQLGGGDHVANCGYVTCAEHAGMGVATAMHLHSVERARARGFTDMQFNFVVASNERAIRLWMSLGFEVVGRLPRAFRHPDPELGRVDAIVMFRSLADPPTPWETAARSRGFALSVDPAIV